MPFAGQVNAIRDELTRKPAEQIQGYLARGNQSYAFIVPYGSRSYVARIDQSRYIATAIEHRIAVTGRARGLPGFEQLVGASSEQGATISELLPGKSIESYTTTEISALPDAPFERLANSSVEAARRGIRTDGNDGNLLLDLEAGFGVLDFGATDEPNWEIATSLTESIFKTKFWLTLHNKIPLSECVEDYEVLEGVLSDIIPVYDRWLGILYETNRSHAGNEQLRDLGELEKTSEAMKLAGKTLAQNGAAEQLVVAAKQWREETVSKLHRLASVAANDTIRDNVMGRVRLYEHPNQPLFPNGNRWVSRNNR